MALHCINLKIVYDALIQAAWETVEAFTGKGNKAGMI
jgi:hypothetical protein